MTTRYIIERFVAGLIAFLLIYLFFVLKNAPTEECNHGVLYKISYGQSSSRTLLVDKDGKPLTCEELNK